jgi:hypothetical protein
MKLNFVHEGAPTQTIGDRRSAAALPTPNATAESGIHVQAAIWSGRACCCPAKPAVLVIMPPSADRLQPTELLLCWAHYRASQRSLAAARVTAHLADSTPAADPLAIRTQRPRAASGAKRLLVRGQSLTETVSR